MEQDVRWKQRYNNFQKAMLQLKDIIEKENLNKIELQGLVQCFEYSFELAWKTMKDYLEIMGYEINSPRRTIQTAFIAGIIDDGHLWIEALEKRNLMSHTYDEKIFEEVVKLIREKYYDMLNNLYNKLSSVE